jgi:hypothetical protein
MQNEFDKYIDSQPEAFLLDNFCDWVTGKKGRAGWLQFVQMIFSEKMARSCPYFEEKQLKSLIFNIDSRMSPK